MSTNRFDVSWREHGPTLDYHFCREWDGEKGCYGTNPDHGQSFEDAIEQIADWHREQSEYWRAMTIEKARELGLI